MHSNSMSTKIVHNFRFFRVYEDGRVEKLYPTHKIPPSTDPLTGVQSKDVIISHHPHLSARLFLPKIHDPTHKIPVLFYVHGGGFCFQSAFSPMYHHHLTKLAAEANVVAVSIEYGLFPEQPIPACYDDSWVAFRWVAGHARGNGPERWLNDHADFTRVFISGESAGGNISHNLAVRIGPTKLPGLNVAGLILVQPFFGGSKDDEMWLYMCRKPNGGLEDPRLNPPVEDLERIGCDRILIFLAENDPLREVGGSYCEKLKRSNWVGSLEIVEHEGEGHVFHLMNPNCVNAFDLVKRIVSFINNIMSKI